MFTRIMVAIDGGEISKMALLEAKRMAASHRATLGIVYAASDSEEADQEAGLTLLAQAKSAVSDDIAVETRVLHTQAMYGVTGIAETVANAANEWGADLVVVGSSHRRGLERLVIGSVAEQLIAKVEASILLVR